MGSDSRAFVDTASEASSFGSAATQTGQRSDVIIVVRLVPKTRQIEMLSIPRDTYVPIPGTGGSNRVNAAFNTGPGLLVKTIQEDFGIPINHVVVANFPGFEGMVNSLGGISLDFRYPVRDPDSGLNVTTVGCQTVNGSTALALVRSRHLYYFKDGSWNYDGMSDWSRIQRQQAFFHAVINKANGELPNLLAINSFLRATANDLQVDSGFASREMISLGMHFRGTSSASLSTEVLPTYGATVNGSDVLMTAQPYAPDDLELPRDRVGLVRPVGDDDLVAERGHDNHSREPGGLRQSQELARTLEPDAVLSPSRTRPRQPSTRQRADRETSWRCRPRSPRTRSRSRRQGRRQAPRR